MAADTLAWDTAQGPRGPPRMRNSHGVVTVPRAAVGIAQVGAAGPSRGPLICQWRRWSGLTLPLKSRTSAHHSLQTCPAKLVPALHQGFLSVSPFLRCPSTSPGKWHFRFNLRASELVFKGCSFYQFQSICRKAGLGCRNLETLCVPINHYADRFSILTRA